MGCRPDRVARSDQGPVAMSSAALPAARFQWFLGKGVDCRRSYRDVRQWASKPMQDAGRATGLTPGDVRGGGECRDDGLYDLRHTGHTLKTRSSATLKDMTARAEQSSERAGLT